MKTTLRICAALAALTLSCPLYAQTVEVKDAWVRATVPGQMSSGAFMTLQSKEGATLVGVATPVAEVAEVHEMTMDGDVMRMRALATGLVLPAGEPVDLKAGGYHVMLMDLNVALSKGKTIPMTLVFKDAKGREFRMKLKVPVKP